MPTTAEATVLNRNANSWINELEHTNPILRRLACRALEKIWCPAEEMGASAWSRQGCPIIKWGSPISRVPVVANLFARMTRRATLDLAYVARLLASLDPVLLRRQLLAAKLRPLLSDSDPTVRQEAADVFQRLR